MFHFALLACSRSSYGLSPPPTLGEDSICPSVTGGQSTACFPGPWNGLAQHIKKDPDICVPLTLPKVASLAGSTAL